jgi:hypothetical protein
VLGRFLPAFSLALSICGAVFFTAIHLGRLMTKTEVTVPLDIPDFFNAFTWIWKAIACSHANHQMWLN